MATATKTKTKPTIADVRAWAISVGWDVGERGTLSYEVITDYNKRHRSNPYTR